MPMKQCTGARKLTPNWPELSRKVAVLAALVVVWVATFAHAGEIDQATKDYLEGGWLIDKQPNKGPCAADAYEGATQWEFEFRKTGGRLMSFEPPDLFTPVAIHRIEQNSDSLAIWGKPRVGPPSLLKRIRLLLPDRLQLLPVLDDNANVVQPATIAYRCSSPDLSVNNSVTISDLALLTPNITLSQGFPEAASEVSDRDLCSGEGNDASKTRNRPWLQFELLGPVHYWVVGLGFGPEQRAKHKLELDLIRKIQRIDEHSLKLSIQERQPGKSKGWDVVENMGRSYDLTIIDRGGRIEIPELSATFVRCEANEPGGVGLRRY